MEYNPQKPIKTPGLPIRAILENPAKRPDPIRAQNERETLKRAHFGFFETRVLCLVQNRSALKAARAKKMPAKLQ
jgi:hypothetical protein